MIFSKRKMTKPFDCCWDRTTLEKKEGVSPKMKVSPNMKWTGTTKTVKLCSPEKTTVISSRHRRFPREMAFEKRARKFRADDWSLRRSRWYFRLVAAIRSTTQIWVVTRHQYRISRGNQWWFRKMSAVSSGWSFASFFGKLPGIFAFIVRKLRTPT